MIILKYMVKQLNLPNVITKNCRAENFPAKCDTIVARGVTNFFEFTKSFSKLLDKHGRIFYLKGGNCTNELKLFKNCHLHNVADVVGIPELSDKVILEVNYANW